MMATSVSMLLRACAAADVNAEASRVTGYTRKHLINSRFAYVSVSRASFDVRIYTNHAASLGKDLSHEVTKSAAMEVSQSVGQAATERSQGIRM